MVGEGVHEVNLLKPGCMLNISLKLFPKRYFELFEDNFMGCPRGLNFRKSIEKYVWKSKTATLR